jgi:MtN3 and saliva related transmembrane protein
MSPVLIEAIGVLAASLTTLAWVPQALKTLRTRSTRDISLWMQAAMTAGIGAWLVYGLLIGSWPLIGANAVTFALVSAILLVKLRHG